MRIGMENNPSLIPENSKTQPYIHFLIPQLKATLSVFTQFLFQKISLSINTAAALRLIILTWQAMYMVLNLLVMHYYTLLVQIFSAVIQTLQLVELKVACQIEPRQSQITSAIRCYLPLVETAYIWLLKARSKSTCSFILCMSSELRIFAIH